MMRDGRSMKNSNKEEKIKIVIIDSGFTKHKDVESVFKGVEIKYNEDDIVLGYNINDNIGHGTAITFLIKKNFPDAEIFCIKIYDDEYSRPELLIAALDYVYKNINCNIVNISLGTVACSDLTQLRECCNRLISKGIIIVSAFDNNGTISYPAAFDSVIGVDASYRAGDIKDYIYVENSPVNIIGYHREQRLPWRGNGYQIVSGASFISPYITVHVAKLISKGYTTLEAIKKQLRKNATETIICEKEVQKKYFIPEKAIVFPFNKEIHSIARYYNELDFEISEFYDVKYTGNIGKTTKQVIGGICQSNHQIKNYKKIDWNSDFDTVILGHTSAISNAIKIDYKHYFLEHALINNKRVISFDSISDHYCHMFSEKRIEIYSPYIKSEDVPKNQFGKLRKIGKPIVAIVGTGPRQGKFTLQISIKTILEHSGYSVGMLGTEPSSLILGANEIYPMGYASTVDVSGIDAIKVVNNLLGRIEDREPEIIIVGSQSQSTPFTCSSIKYLPIPQHELLLATAPDCYILCVNLSDDIDYIKRTIAYLESLFGAKVLMLATLPFEQAQKWSVLNNKKTHLLKDEVKKKASIIKKATKLDVYDISDQKDLIKIVEIVVGYFSSIE